MARIRSIKPEFPQSESMGRVSRDARLLFVMLWPICDDHGRTRAASRMLASLLFPYDDDAPGLIDGWLDELERESCITRYEANGSTFLVVTNWLKHQKIDKPSKPQFPEPPEGFARIREDSSEERKGKEGKGKEIPPEVPSAGSVVPVKPKGAGAIELQTWIDSLPADQNAITDADPIYAYADSIGLPDEYITLAWLWFKAAMVGKRKKDWRAHFRNAVRNGWPKYWWPTDDGGWRLSPAGEQAKRAMEAAA